MGKWSGWLADGSLRPLRVEWWGLAELLDVAGLLLFIVVEHGDPEEESQVFSRDRAGVGTLLIPDGRIRSSGVFGIEAEEDGAVLQIGGVGGADVDVAG